MVEIAIQIGLIQVNLMIDKIIVKLAPILKIEP